MDKINISKRFSATMSEIADQIKLNANSIKEFELKDFLNLIIETNKNGNTIFVYGAGRSGFMGRAFAQRMMHLGISSCFVSDAVTHQYTKKDLLILISGSGETTSPVAIGKKAKEIGGNIALITANPQSSIGQIADCIITILGKSKDKATAEKTLAPYTSLFDISTLSFLDSVGGILMGFLNVSEADIDKRHATVE
ncbi:MAG: 6-phospho-3-hexuloisomerase [Promethearchaeota archaeon]|nr:MAG: 6-phospho-3-hexuloisomerase [Candidatus Lokiarchaeota archaeon]